MADVIIFPLFALVCEPDADVNFAVGQMVSPADVDVRCAVVRHFGLGCTEKSVTPGGSEAAPGPVGSRRCAADSPATKDVCRRYRRELRGKTWPPKSALMLATLLNFPSLVRRRQPVAFGSRRR